MGQIFKLSSVQFLHTGAPIFESADVKTILILYFSDHASDNSSPLFKNLFVLWNVSSVLF